MKKPALVWSIIGLVFAIALLAVNLGVVWFINERPGDALIGPLRQASETLTTIFALLVVVLPWVGTRRKRPRRPLIAAEADRDTVIRRRRDAKRWNERLKLLAAFLNTIGASSFIALAIIPMVMSGNQHPGSAFYGLGIAVGCHGLGQSVLWLWKTEE